MRRKKEKVKGKTKVGLFISDEVATAARVLAARRHTTVSKVYEDALREYLQRQSGE